MEVSAHNGGGAGSTRYPTVTVDVQLLHNLTPLEQGTALESPKTLPGPRNNKHWGYFSTHISLHLFFW